MSKTELEQLYTLLSNIEFDIIKAQEHPMIKNVTGILTIPYYDGHENYQRHEKSEILLNEMKERCTALQNATYNLIKHVEFLEANPQFSNIRSPDET